MTTSYMWTTGDISPPSPRADVTSASREDALIRKLTEIISQCEKEDGEEGCNLVVSGFRHLVPSLLDLLRSGINLETTAKVHICRLLTILVNGDTESKSLFNNQTQVERLLRFIRTIKDKLGERQNVGESEMIYLEELVNLFNIVISDYPPIHKLFIKNGGLALLLSLCGCKIGAWRCRPIFNSLTMNKTLVGKVMTISTETVEKITPIYMNGLQKSLPTKDIYEIDLYDTSTEEDVSIRDELIGRGIAEPCNPVVKETTLETCREICESDFWTDIHVTHGIDGKHFWAVLGEMAPQAAIVQKTAEKIQDAKGLPYLHCAPGIGDILLLPSDDLSLTSMSFVRVQVYVKVDITVTVFGIDYGFVTDIPWGLLRPLPCELESLELTPIQPCCLRGVNPSPLSFPVLEHVLSILSVMCADITNDDLAVDVAQLGGFHIAVRFCNSTLRHVRYQATKLLKTLAKNCHNRARLAYLDALPALVNTCEKFTDEQCFIITALEGIELLVANVDVNKRRLINIGGKQTLLKLKMSSDNTDIETLIKSILKSLENIKQDTCAVQERNSGLERKVQGVDLFQFLKSKFVTPMLQQQNNSSHSNRSPPQMNNRSPPQRNNRSHTQVNNRSHTQVNNRSHTQVNNRSHTQVNNGESKTPTNPNRTYGHNLNLSYLPQRTMITKIAMSDELTHDNNDSVDSSSVRSMSPERHQGSYSNRKHEVNRDKIRHQSADLLIEEEHWVQRSSSGVIDDATHDIQATFNARRLTRPILAKIMCAFLNSGQGGSIYLGLSIKGTVQGVELNRSERDGLRLGVDGILHDIHPSVTLNLYHVYFIKVKKNSPHSSSCYVTIPDYYVVEIRISPQHGTVYTYENKCIFREGEENVRYHFEDLRLSVWREESAKISSEILELKHEIEQLNKLKLLAAGRHSSTT